MGEDVLKYEVEGPIASIILDRPKAMNSFNRELRLALLNAMQNAEADGNVRIVILSGEGRGFCAGADLTERSTMPVDEMLDTEYKPFLMAIANSSKIYIASVSGAAAGKIGRASCRKRV